MLTCSNEYLTQPRFYLLEVIFAQSICVLQIILFLICTCIPLAETLWSHSVHVCWYLNTQRQCAGVDRVEMTDRCNLPSNAVDSGNNDRIIHGWMWNIMSSGLLSPDPQHTAADHVHKVQSKQPQFLAQHFSHLYATCCSKIVIGPKNIPNILTVQRSLAKKNSLSAEHMNELLSDI